MKAKYDVAVAKLDAGKSEVVSRIEGAEANLKVADAEQALHQAEAQLKSDAAVDQATVQDKRMPAARRNSMRSAPKLH